MTAAIFGIIGVIVGGVLNGLVALRLERARERRAVRAAARLLLDPLRSIETELSFALSSNRWWPLRAHQLDEVDGMWARHRELLASDSVALADWEEILLAFQGVRAIYANADHAVSTYSGHRADAPLDHPIGSDVWQEALRMQREQIQAGRAVLERLAADPGRTWWRPLPAWPRRPRAGGTYEGRDPRPSPNCAASENEKTQP